MTVKNVRTTIEKCIDSLERQAIDDYFEIVVVDSASTDGTLEYLLKKAETDERLKVVEKESSQPEALVSAFQDGLVTSRFVALIDGDVVADERWLSELVSSSEQGNRFVGGPCFTPEDVNILQRLIGFDLDSRFMKMLEGRVTRLPNMNLCVERQYFIEVCFDTNLALGYDMEFGHRLRIEGQAIWYNPRAIVYHYHRSSLRAFVKQQINGSEHALRVFRKYPSAALGDNINPFRMLIDAPLLALLIASILLLPLGIIAFYVAALAAFGLLASVAFKTVDLALTSKNLETIFCPIIFLIRGESWLLGLVQYIYHSALPSRLK